MPVPGFKGAGFCFPTPIAGKLIELSTAPLDAVFLANTAILGATDINFTFWMIFHLLGASNFAIAVSIG